VSIDPCAARLFLVLFLTEPRQGDEDDPIAQNLTNPATGLVSIEPSHADMEYDRINLSRVRDVAQRIRSQEYGIRDAADLERSDVCEPDPRYCFVKACAILTARPNVSA
jgi:hypothetical protein